ncbi:MAG: response regulator transcription factor [Candidatus Nanoperiomorbaceae bacterium]
MKVLLVEDEPRLAAAVARGLKQEKYNVEISDNGCSALTLINNGDYDLMIFDRMMPGMDGLTLTKEVRKANIKTPILILTAKGQTRDKVDGLNAGADDYMSKPFAFDELLARLRALARRPAEQKPETLTVGDLSLNFASYECIRNGRNIDLTETEFKILAYLMRHPGIVLTKDQIVNQVWDYDADILPNTVEAYISYLRKKIDRPFEKKIIITKRGIGYKLDGTR